MVEADKSEFIRVIVGLAAIKPGGSNLTKESYEIWWNALKSWPLDAFKTAAAQLASTVEFMPSPFHFNQIKKADKPTSGEAWAIALKNCTCWRTGESPGGLIDRAAAAIGGYRTIALADIETSLPHLERRFKEAYAELEDVEESRETVALIEGRKREDKDLLAKLYSGERTQAPRRLTGE
jgi:hypothetical protein